MYEKSKGVNINEAVEVAPYHGNCHNGTQSVKVATHDSSSYVNLIVKNRGKGMEVCMQGSDGVKLRDLLLKVYPLSAPLPALDHTILAGARSQGHAEGYKAGFKDGKKAAPDSNRHHPSIRMSKNLLDIGGGHVAITLDTNGTSFEMRQPAAGGVGFDWIRFCPKQAVALRDALIKALPAPDAKPADPTPVAPAKAPPHGLQEYKGLGKHTWEAAEQDDTERLRVPGGWLYRTYTGKKASTVFVPMPDAVGYAV